MRALSVCALLSSLLSSWAQAQCPLPEVALPAAAAAELEPTLAALQVLVLASKNDAARAAVDVSSLGRELEALPAGRPLPPAVIDMARRLRRLDCAVLDGAEAPAQAFAAITDEARALIGQLTKPEPMPPPPTGPRPPPPRVELPHVELPPPPVLPAFMPPPPPPGNARSGRRMVKLGGVFLGIGIAIAVIAIATTADAANWSYDKGPYSRQDAEVVVAASSWFLGTAALVGGTAFLVAGKLELRRAKRR